MTFSLPTLESTEGSGEAEGEGGERACEPSCSVPCPVLYPIRAGHKATAPRPTGSRAHGFPREEHPPHPARGNCWSPTAAFHLEPEHMSNKCVKT